MTSTPRDVPVGGLQVDFTPIEQFPDDEDITQDDEVSVVDDRLVVPDAAEEERGTVGGSRRRNPLAAVLPPLPFRRNNDSESQVLGDSGEEEVDDTPSPREARRAAANAKTKARKSASAARKEAAQRKRAIRRGSQYGGDRWKVITVLLLLATFALCSILSLITSLSRPSKSAVAAEVQRVLTEGGKDFPQGQAVMWAGQALRTWGTWDEKTAEARKIAIAPYLSSGMDGQAGWNGKGKQDVIFASVNPQPRVVDANRAVVDAVYQINDGSWRCVSIPVFAYKPTEFQANAQWAFALTSNPAPTSCTPRTGATNIGNSSPVSLTAGGKKNDPEIALHLQRNFFPGFFAAYAASDEAALVQYTDSGVRLMGMGGAMTSIPAPLIINSSIFVPKNGAQQGVVYQALVTVTWTLANSTSQTTATYEVPIRQDGDRWVVTGNPVPTVQGSEVGTAAPATVPTPGEGVTPGSYPSTLPTTSTPEATTKPTTQTNSATTAPKKKAATPSASPSSSSRKSN